MATNLTAATAAQLQGAITLLVGSSAYETPISEDVIQRVAPVVAALKLATVGGAYAAFRDNPTSALIALVAFAGEGVLTEAQEAQLMAPFTDETAESKGRTGAAGLMLLGSAYEKPFAEDVIARLAPVAESTGFLRQGAFYEAIKNNPVSTMFKWALKLGTTGYTGGT